jgi:hypothetical protein
MLFAQVSALSKVFGWLFGLNLNHSSHLPAYEDGTDCSETSAYKIQTPGNYPDGSTQHSEQSESFKSKCKFIQMKSSLNINSVYSCTYCLEPNLYFWHISLFKGVTNS